jgi:hypothetical protein
MTLSVLKIRVVKLGTGQDAYSIWPIDGVGEVFKKASCMRKVMNK